MNYKLIAYACDFVSFLLEKIKEKTDKINQIVIFGSVTRAEDSKESDIDLFLDTPDSTLENEINDLKEKFYDSIKVKKYWSLLGVDNDFHCVVGELEKWDDLKRSIISNGIVLYGRYEGITKTQHYFLFIVTPGRSRNKNISVWRKLYGYKQRIGKKTYIKKGLVNDYNGKKLARGVFIIPSKNSQKIISFLKKERFKYKITPFWTDKE